MSASVKQVWGWSYDYGGVFKNVKLNSTNITIRVILNQPTNSEWGAALSNFGRSDAKVRVTIGNTYSDITISQSGLGAEISSAPGWTINGNIASRSLNNFLTTSANFGIPLAQNNLNPPIWGFPPELVGLGFTEGWCVIASTFAPTRSGRIPVLAYEVDPPDGQYFNLAGWTPNYEYVGPDLGIDGINIIQPSNPLGLDQEMTSIFKQRIIVSQSAYQINAKSVYQTGSYPLSGPGPQCLQDVGETPEAGSNTTTLDINLDPQAWIENLGPVMNISSPFPPPNYNIYNKTGEEQGKTGSVPNPPRDGGGNRPIIGSFHGGNGGTPAYDDYVLLEVTPNPIEHDDTDVGTVKTKSFTVTNAGTLPVEVTEIVNTHPDNIFLFSMNSPIGFPFTIEPGESFGGTAYFEPVNEVVYNEIGYVKSGANIIRSFSVLGTGTAGGNPGEIITRKIALTGDTSSKGDLNFLETTIGQSVTKNIKIFNVGNFPLVLNSVSLGGAGVFTSPGIPAGFTLQVGEFLEVPVTFTPVGAQEYLGTFTVNSNAEESDQPGFNPATGAITCNLRGLGTALTPITRIMSFNVQNDGTFSDVLAGGSASDEITATITNIGNATLLISQFQVEQPFSLELDAFGNYSIGSFEFYSLEEPLLIEAGQTSQPFTIKFTPPTATNFVDDVFVNSNKTIGPEAFEVRGFGTLGEPEPEEPEGPILPDDEPPPGQEFDPGTVPSSALDGNGAACIPKECEVTYVYEYSSNGEIVT